MTRLKNAPQTILIYLFLLAAACILLYPVVFTRTASFFINPDNLHQAYPFFNKLATSLHKGYLPVWDANTYTGKNFSGEFQSGIFYPLNLLWCLLFGNASGIDVYHLDLLIAFHYLICLLGMYQLARIFRLSPDASIITALVFTFTGVMSSRANAQTCIFVGLAWMPWAIYFIGKFYNTGAGGHKKYLFFSGVIGALQILGGHVQPFFHTLMIIGAIIIFYEYNNKKNWAGFYRAVIINTAVVILTALILALPQVYYAIQYLSQAYRWVAAENPIGPGEKVPFHVYAYKNIVRLSDIPNLFARSYTQPDDDNLLYMGILPLFLLLFWSVKRTALSLTPEHRHLKKILAIILGLGILCVLGYVTFFCVILYEIPFVNSVRELGRYGILINFSGALLAGLAIHYLPQLHQSLTGKYKGLKIGVLAVLCINALYLAFAEHQHMLPIAITIPFLLTFLFFFLLLRAPKAAYFGYLAIVFVFADLYLNKVNNTGTDSDFYPPRYYARDRIIDFLETTYGKYRVAFDIQKDELLRRNIGDVYQIQTKLGYCATMNKPYFDFIACDWALNSEVNNMLNVRYIVTDKQLDSNFIFKDSAHQLNLYERRNYYPRIYWKEQLGKPGPEIEAANNADIKTLTYSDIYQKIEVDCRTADTLIVSENHYPGWKCYDNGQQIPIYKPTIGKYPPIFRSVALQKGRHLLEFRYNKVFHWF